jgi:hypothetical protein
MSYDKNAFKATGEKPHEAFDFIAYPGDKKTWAPTWGFVTTSKGLDESLEEEVFPRGDWPLFRFGGSFGGWVYGAAAHGGSPDDSGNVGPDVVTNYSDFAGVFGTGVYVTGVAGTSVNNVGVYGQTGELTDGQIPQNIAAGVYGATKNRYSYGVLGWSTNGPGIKGWSPVYNAVDAESVHGRAVSAYSGYETGVHGDSQGAAGVRGVSDVLSRRRTDHPQSGDYRRGCWHVRHYTWRDWHIECERRCLWLFQQFGRHFRSNEQSRIFGRCL